jgi:glycosyltransferase involved in cell wall biosynthesis
VSARLRIAFVKFGGLASSGTERWLQMMAANLDRDRFAVDYFYCDAAPYIGSDFRHADTDADRVDYMRRAGVNLVKFSVGAKDITTPTHDWVDTDFWELFDERAYDLVQTAKAGPPEYPYDRMALPVVEYVTLSAGVDRSRNIARSVQISQWQRRQWLAAGGDPARSDVIYIPAEPPASELDLREELGIPAGAVVAGFHQRASDEIFSPVPLAAFRSVQRKDRWFALMGGSALYRRQAADLGLSNVAFLDHEGGAERISRFLNTLDVFAHGRSDGETFGTVFAEAMMHGRPCLSHRSPIANAQPETMGPAGLFASDEPDYTGKLDALLGDPGLRARLGAKARPHAERYYSLGSCVDALEDVYDGLTDRPRPAARAPRPPAYGRSDLGFLVAGNLGDPRSAAHHVVAGPLPQVPAVHLIPALVTPLSTVAEVGSANTVLVLQAARIGARSRLFGPPGPELDALAAAVVLNNWEDRLWVRPTARPADLDREQLRDADVIIVNDAGWLATVVAGVDAGSDIVLLVDADPGQAFPAADLAAKGYRWRRVGLWAARADGTRPPRSQGWYLCAPRSRPLDDVSARWTQDRRRQRRVERAAAAKLLGVRAGSAVRLARLTIRGAGARARAMARSTN